MKKKVLFALLFTISVLCFTSQVSAMTPTWRSGAKFTRGVKNTCYYVDSSANSYVSMINSAAKSWASMKNNIKNTAVASKKGTHIDFYARTISQDTHLTSNINGYTMFYDDKGITVQGSPTTAPLKDYFYTDIIINKQGNAGSDTMAHEMGHAYGLKHSTNKYSILYTPKSERKVTTPQDVDNDTINYLYP